MPKYQAIKTFRDGGHMPPQARRPGDKYDSPAGDGHVKSGKAIELAGAGAAPSGEATGAPGARPSPSGRTGAAKPPSRSRPVQAPRKRKPR